jgi:class 3 adenylate cyclase
MGCYRADSELYFTVTAASQMGSITDLAVSPARLLRQRGGRRDMTERGVGILFSDVAGSTRLYEVLGDRAALAAVERCLELASRTAVDYGGTIIRMIGDELMISFAEARAMFDAAVAMQRSIAMWPPLNTPHGDLRLRLRIGFEFGPAIVTSADIFGTTVNMAARMVGFARAGQIITTGSCAALVSPAHGACTRSLDLFPVKGLSGEVQIVEVLWQQTPDMTVIPGLGHRAVALSQSGRLRLCHRGREWVFAGNGEAIALGREPGNHIVVEDLCASRKHATVERRRDKWVLVDHSTNGTFVTFDGEPELSIRHEELLLRGAGTISLGRSADDPAACVGFALVGDA